LALADQKTCPPSMCSFITLITYLFSLLPFTCLACLCDSLCLCTLALTPYPTRCVGLSTYVIKSFLLFHSTVALIIFILVCSKFFSPKFFTPPPPGSCHPFFTFYPTLHLPDFLQPACFSACLLLLRVSLCPWRTARVSLSAWVGLKGFCVCLLLLKKGG
jgi:hypothetical protein